MIRHTNIGSEKLDKSDKKFDKERNIVYNSYNMLKIHERLRGLHSGQRPNI